MLWRILQAHGGKLPDDVIVTFANTGMEREETLRFVHECGSRWGVPIVWLEWRREKPGFEVVGYNSASRGGEPFEALIRWKKRLPNWQERWCTGFLKVLTMHAYNRSIGRVIGRFVEVIGLRDDEGPRILTGRSNAVRDKRMAFWREQPFDLGLKPHEGNCTLCFLKGKKLRKRIIRDTPGVEVWWQRMETEFGFFDKRDLVADLAREVYASPELDFIEEGTPEYDTECGDSCGGDSLVELQALQHVYEQQKAPF